MTQKPPFLLSSIFFLIVTVMLWWGFAFLPLPDTTPAWVNQARVVCFGLAENGLPQSYGWLLLIGAPFMMFSAIWISWGHEGKEIIDYVKKNRGMALLCGLFLVVLMTESFFIGKKITAALELGNGATSLNEAQADLAVYPHQNKEPPALNLFNQEGKPVNLAMAKGKVIYVTFAFAHCKAICPTLAAELKKVHEALGPDKSTVFIISLDPWRDTVSALAYMHKQWDLPPTMHVLSGSVAEVNKVLDAFNVPRSRDEQTGEVVHPALVDVIDPQGQLAYTFNGASTQLLIKAGREVMK